MTTPDAVADLLTKWKELSTWDADKLTQFIEGTATQSRYEIQRSMAREILSNHSSEAAPVNTDAARYESFESSYRPLSHGGWFVDEDGEVL